MDRKTFSQQVTAIVPVFNEACRVQRVLDVLVSYPGFFEIIVVDDGSDDTINTVVKKYPVRFIQHKKNKGKAQAMESGIQAAHTEIICFFDADITGLTHDIIDQMITPVISGEVDMFIAMRNRKIYALQFLLTFVPLLGGERTITKQLWNTIPIYYKQKFRIEAALNFFATYYGKGYSFHFFQNVSQTIKEKKYGIINGFYRRVLMFQDLLQAQWKLQTIHTPLPIKNKRKVVLKMIPVITSTVIGVSMLIASWYGPRTVILSIFKKELIEDPSAPIIHALLRVSAVVSAQAIAITAGIIISLNVFMGIRYIIQLIQLKTIFPQPLPQKRNTAK